MPGNVSSFRCFAVVVGIGCALCIAIGLIASGIEIITSDDCTGGNIRIAGTGAVVMGVTFVLFTCATLFCRPVDDPDNHSPQDGSPVIIAALTVAMLCEAVIALPFYFMTDDWSCRGGFITMYRIHCIALLSAAIFEEFSTVVKHVFERTRASDFAPFSVDANV
jgi:hypothetical protein